MITLRRVVCVAALAVAGAWAQHQQEPRPEFSADSRLVVVPVTVIDRHGALRDGLSRDAFTILEDGVAQQIQSFSEDDAPVSIGIVLDLSGSMKGLLGVAREAFRRFAALSNPSDEAFLNTVSTRPREWSGFTGDLDGLFRSVASEEAAGRTALVDTVWLTLNQLRSARNARKALLVISDGMDNQSRRSRKQLLDRAVETDAQIYTVTTYQPQINARAMSRGLPSVSLDQQNGLLLMHDLAARTGGLQFVVHARGEIEPAIESLSRVLRNQYNIGYVPGNAGRSGKWRRIQVRIAGNGLQAYARRGYRLN